MKKLQEGVLFQRKQKKWHWGIGSDVGSDMMLCAEVCCGSWKSWAPEEKKKPPREVCNASDREAEAAGVELPSQVGGVGIGKWEEPESQSLSWTSSAPYEACKHSQLKRCSRSPRPSTLTPPRGHFNPDFPHNWKVASQWKTEKKEREKENTQSLRKTSKRSAMYRRNRPVEGDRNNSCVTAKMFSSPRWRRSLCVLSQFFSTS